MSTRNIKTTIAVDGEKAFNNAMKEINSNLRALKAELGATESAFKSQGNSTESLRAKHSKLAELYEQQKVKVQTLKQALDEAKAKYGENSPEVDRLRTSLANATRELNNTEAALKGTSNELENMHGSVIDAAAAMEIAKAAADKLMSVLKDCASSSIEFESGMAAVSRTTGISGEALAVFGDSLKELSTEIPVSTTELATIAKTAGQLGVSGADNVKNFTTVVAQLATVAEMTTDNAATMMAQFANITGTSDYERLASTIAVLGDSTATTAQRTLEMAQGISAAGTLAGMSSADIIAIAAAVGSLGIEAAAGGTSMSRLITRLDTAVATGEDLNTWASIAGMSAAEFKVAWGNDAAQALNSFIIGLHDADKAGQSMNVTLGELGINNQRELAAIKGLAANGELLTSTLTAGASAWEENSGLTNKASTMYTTAAAQMKLTENAVNNLKIEIGDAFAPILQQAAADLSPFINGLAEFVSNNPEAVQAIAAVTTGVVTLTSALAAYNAVSAAVASLGGITAILGGAGPMAALGATLGFVAVGLAQEGAEAKRMAAEMAQAGESIEEMEERLSGLKNRLEELKTEDFTNQYIRNEYDATKQAIKATEDQIESYTATAETAAGATENQANFLDSEAGACAVLQENIAALITAYEAAYEAAKESLSGQFGLFQEVAEVSTTSAADMIKGLQSQADYFNKYADNLGKLRDGTVAGLNEDIIASVSDGSQAAVENAASIVAGYEEALSRGEEAAAEYVNNINVAYEAQQAAVEAAAAEIAAAQTNLDGTWTTLINSAAEAAGELDMSEEMAAAGADTINAYISGLSSGSGPLYDTAVMLAAQLTAGLNAGAGGSGVDGKHATGLDYVPFDGYIAELHRGEMVLTAQAAAEMRKARAIADVSAEIQTGGKVTNNITNNFYPQNMSDAQMDYIANRINRQLGGMS